MLELPDVTFMIPLHIDTLERLENVLICVEYLNRHCNTNVAVWEYDKEPKADMLAGKCSYRFIKDDMPHSYKSKWANDMAKSLSTPIVALHDADAILPDECVLNAVDKIRSDELDVCWSYDTFVRDIPPEYKKKVLDDYSLDFLRKMELKPLIGNRDYISDGVPVGYSFFVNREKYLSIGGLNEKIKGYGPEDVEFYYRSRNIGLRIGRAKGTGYHLNHGRSLYGGPRKHPYVRSNNEETAKVLMMNREELEKYVATWSWK